MLDKLVVVGAVSFTLAACHHAVPAAESSRGEAEGRILVQGGLRGPGVSFSAERVIGPTINMTRYPDGNWVGWIRNVPLNLTVTPGRISSPSLTMNIQELPQGVEISGLLTEGAVLGNLISIRVTPKELYVWEPFVNPPVYLEGVGEGSYGTGHYGNSVELKGTAALLHPPEPQFALALLGAF